MDKPTDFEVPTVCPFCGKQNAQACEPEADPDERAPEDGDAILCVGCGEWSIFDTASPGGMRKPAFEEHEKIVANPMTGIMREAWLAFKEEEKRKHKAPKGGDAHDVKLLIEKIRPMLAGQDPAIITLVLADLVAILIAGHRPDLRDKAREFFDICVDDLMEKIYGCTATAAR